MPNSLTAGIVTANPATLVRQTTTPGSAVIATALLHGRMQILITADIPTANLAIIDPRTTTPGSAAIATKLLHGEVQILVIVGKQIASHAIQVLMAIGSVNAQSATAPIIGAIFKSKDTIFPWTMVMQMGYAPNAMMEKRRMLTAINVIINPRWLISTMRRE
jgi:hypothetical protein